MEKDFPYRVGEILFRTGVFAENIRLECICANVISVHKNLKTNLIKNITLIYTLRCSKAMPSSQKTTILCFGNPLLKEDNLALKVGKLLEKDLDKKKYKVRYAVQVDEILEHNFNKLLIIDVAADLKENQIRLINNINALQSSNICSLHDFDVGFFLKLMKELGRIQQINILAIPQQGSPETIADKVKQALITPKQ